MLKESSLQKLRTSKNLLAFSGGVDSSALFFTLLENNIKFDIAIVDYGVREQSKEELAYAKELAKKYELQCHIKSAPKIEKNFESKAREIRYSFFESLIKKQGYETLLTAHHLGDRFEWMLMQFCKGAGCAELGGMREIERRESHFLVRPLLHKEKSELLEYLHEKNINYFEDESNLDESIKRNAFRHNYAKPLLKEYLHGIKKSFEYIDADVESLIEKQELYKIDDFAYFKTSKNQRSNIYTIDKYLKSIGHIISAYERALLREQKSLVVGRAFLVVQMEKYMCITPYVKGKTKLDKEFKEECRVLKIDTKLREYLFLNPKIFILLKKLLRA